MNIKDLLSKLKISKKKDKTYSSAINTVPNYNVQLIYDSNYTNNTSRNTSYVEDPNIIGDDYQGYYNIRKTKDDIKERIKKKPVEVWEELFDETPKIDLTGIDEKIKLVEKRLEYLKFLNGQTNDEIIALKYLNARKKFLKYIHLFIWPITTKTKINELCKKYTLEDENFNSYSKCIPMEAIDELEKYIKAWNKIAPKNSKPHLGLIIDDSQASIDSPLGERKKDPILYAESPFGKWFYVLGAWDKEVECVDEIVYRGK
jgi:hypothetical protein